MSAYIVQNILYIFILGRILPVYFDVSEEMILFFKFTVLTS